MRRIPTATLLLGSFAFAVGQTSPGTQRDTPPQPVVAQPQPGIDPAAPNAVLGAPPAFVPGTVADNNQPPARPGMARTSGGVMAGNLLSKVDPVCPENARAAHVSGAVVMNARVGKDGHVQNLAVISGPQSLRTAAVDAVRQWVYRPHILHGQPVDGMTMVTVNFGPR